MLAEIIVKLVTAHSFSFVLATGLSILIFQYDVRFLVHSTEYKAISCLDTLIIIILVTRLDCLSLLSVFYDSFDIVVGIKSR